MSSRAASWRTRQPLTSSRTSWSSPRPSCSDGARQLPPARDAPAPRLRRRRFQARSVIVGGCESD